MNVLVRMDRCLRLVVSTKILQTLLSKLSSYKHLLRLTVDNLGNANVYGVEFEFRQRLGFISEGLNNLKVNANVSIIKSELTMSDDEFESRTLLQEMVKL